MGMSGEKCGEVAPFYMGKLKFTLRFEKGITKRQKMELTEIAMSKEEMEAQKKKGSSENL